MFVKCCTPFRGKRSLKHLCEMPHCVCLTFFRIPHPEKVRASISLMTVIAIGAQAQVNMGWRLNSALALLTFGARGFSVVGVLLCTEGCLAASLISIH